MHTKLRTVTTFVLLFSVLVVGAAQAPPTAQQVVERFTDALSAGDLVSVVSVLAGSATWSEHDLYWRTATGTDLQIRANEMMRAGVRLEADVVAVLGDGHIVITHERMWGDFVPEGLAPLRSTTVYVVESGWLVGITRVLSADQRDALVLATLADSAWGDPSASVYHRYDADGTYRNYASLAAMRSGHHFFSGTYGVEHGVFTWMADADSHVCSPGQRLVMRGRMIDEDTWIGTLIPGETDCTYYRDLLTDSYLTTRLADE